MRTADVFAPVLSIIAEPFHAVVDYVKDISGVSSLRAENEKLERENARLREWYRTALLLQAENKSLQTLLNVKLEPQGRYVTTRVVADSGSSYVKSILVAAGTDDNVQKGSAVLSGEGLIGRVVETGREAARVLLISDYNSRVPVMVEGSNHRAILTGTNESRPVLKYLPPDTDIPEGARIITSGHGGMFAAGMPIGEVVYGEDGSFQVKPFADMNRLTYVRVVERPVDPNLIQKKLEEQ